MQRICETSIPLRPDWLGWWRLSAADGRVIWPLGPVIKT
jgi:hypothetical protein